VIVFFGGVIRNKIVLISTQSSNNKQMLRRLFLLVLVLVVCLVLGPSGAQADCPGSRLYVPGPELSTDGVSSGCIFYNASTNHVSVIPPAYGMASRGNVLPTDWFVILTGIYGVGTLLSSNGTMGYTAGGMNYTDTGLTIAQDGDYQVTVDVALTNGFTGPVGNSSAAPGAFVPINLVVSGVFNSSIGTLIVIAPTDNYQIPGNIQTAFFTSIATLNSGDTLSVVASSGGADGQNVTVVGWGIVAVRLFP
jgi:hypothetical protein